MTLHLTSCEYAPPEAHLKELHMGENGMRMTWKGSAVTLVAEGLADEFKHPNAVNYVQWEVHRADVGWMVLTLHRKNGKSPGQLVKEHAAEIARLSKLLVELETT